MAKPQSRNQLIDYCLRRLGHPVIEINIDDEQIEDRLDDALQMFMEYNSEGSSRIAQFVEITEAMITNKYIDLNTAFGGAYNNRILSVNRVFPINSDTSSVNTEPMDEVQNEIVSVEEEVVIKPKPKIRIIIKKK